MPYNMFQVTFFLLFLFLVLTGCGTAPAWLATSTGAYSEYKVITFAKTGTDLTLSAVNLPTTNDVVLSKITGYDCKVSRMLDKGLEAICKEIKLDKNLSEREKDDKKDE